MKFWTLLLLPMLLFTIVFNCGQTAVAQFRLRETPTEVLELETVEPNLSVNQIYNKAIRSVVWIVAPDGQGSGVLIDKELKLVVTNEHVVGTNEHVAVLFPAKDKDGNLIEERDFYLNAAQNESAEEVLRQLGYLVDGRVVAKNPETDLAILELEGIAETAIEIDHEFRHVGYQVNMKENVHILGNPGNLKLWRWTLGLFENIMIEDGKEMLHMNADTYRGNSGGPVLNERGKLIGIISRSNLGTSTVAVPLKYVDELLKELKPRHAVYIFNDTIYTIDYLIRVQESDDWEKHSIRPKKGITATVIVNHGMIPEGYPKIRFDHVPDDGNKITLSEKTLKTFRRLAGEDFDPIPGQDAYGYYFFHDPSENKLYLTDKLRENSQVE